MTLSVYGQGTLPSTVRSRMIEDVNGLNVHILEAGFESSARPLALLLHGFPDLAYGWRHLMPLMADAGYHVVAPDQRGSGQHRWACRWPRHCSSPPAWRRQIACWLRICSPPCPAQRLRCECPRKRARPASKLAIY
jgi:pimeloyl-ACP methyl ester carboxylesterase